MAFQCSVGLLGIVRTRKSRSTVAVELLMMDSSFNMTQLVNIQQTEVTLW